VHRRSRKPGDFCLVCREANTEAIVLEAARDRATITMLAGEPDEPTERDPETDRDELVLGETITTTPEDGENEPIELRNFAGLIGDEIRRKRPEEVYAGGVRTVIRAVRDDTHHSFYRVDDDDPVRAVLERRGNRARRRRDAAGRKIGGSHTTLIGGGPGCGPFGPSRTIRTSRR